jgi:transketolase
MVQEALKAHDILKEQGFNVRVIDIHTIKPLDEEIVVKAAKETGCVITVEEHNIIGGLGSAVAEVLGEKCPTPMLRLGMKDEFGKSGKPDDLFEKFGLNAKNIAFQVQNALKQK